MIDNVMTDIITLATLETTLKATLKKHWESCPMLFVNNAFINTKKVIKNILIKPREMIYDSTFSETLS